MVPRWKPETFILIRFLVPYNKAPKWMAKHTGKPLTFTKICIQKNKIYRFEWF